MDFISNLIKRPISLVLNETSTTMDKFPISASLPNNKSDFATPSNAEEKQTNPNLNNNNNRPLSMSSSYNGDHMTDFIGVPDEFLDEFKDILPPPPLSNSDPLSQSILDMDNTSLLAITPPPPPLPTQSETEEMLTSSMKASQTIDELLLQINDNLQQAGLNDDVLAIASPPNKSELNPLSSKTALNNSKLSASASNIQVNTTKTPTTTAAGSASSTVFENNSSIPKFHIDPELETGGIFDDHKQQQHGIDLQHQNAEKDQLNNSSANKSSNKFVGLTEFDEAKIPELPGDLNPNIEEQYNVTFEECFIPTLTAQQGATVNDEFKVDKTHLLLPTETDGLSSDNETFADCFDEKDPLASTFAEPASLDVTTDLESYQSAVNNTLNTNLYNTMENIADITMEAEGQPLKNYKHTQAIEQLNNQPTQPQFEPMDEDEPMDIDMSETLELIHDTCKNLQHVEEVLQHAENIVQHLEDNKQLNESNIEILPDLLEKQKETSKMTLVVNAPVENGPDGNRQHLEIEQAKHEMCLNKSIELPVNKAKTLSTECVIETVNKEVEAEEECRELQHNKSGSNLNSTIDCLNISTTSNFSIKSAAYNTSKSKSDLSLSLNHSMNSQKSSAPTSPSFPIKTAHNAGFPRSPKAVVGKQTETPFLEKSDYLENLQTPFIAETPVNILNGTFVDSSCTSSENNLNGTFVEPVPAIEKNDKRLTFRVDTSMLNPTEELDINATELRNIKDKTTVENRRTFSVKSNGNDSALMQFPSVDNTDNRRRTFNMPSEEFTPDSTQQTEINSSFECMEVDCMSPNTKLPVPTDAGERSQSPPLPATQQESHSAPLPTLQQKSQSPPLPAMQQRSQSPPPLPTVQQRPQSPALSFDQQGSETCLQKPQSPALPAMQQRSQSPCLLAIQPRSQSPPISTIHTRSQSPVLSIMQSSSQSPPISTMQQNSQLPPVSTAQHAINIKEEQISPPAFESTNASLASQPLPTLIQKRPSIRDARARAAEILSAKEQSNIKVKDEKDIYVEKFTPSPIEDIFTAVSATSTTLTNSSDFSEFDQTSSSGASVINSTEQQSYSQQFENEFSGNNNLILNPCDFDYLLTKGNNNTPVDRSSLLLKFDPLLGVPVPVNLGQQQQQLQLLQIPTNTINPCLSPTLEEEEHNDSNRSFVIDTKSTSGLLSSTAGASAKLLKERSQEVKQQLQLEQQIQQNKRQLTQEANKKNATMSVDVIKDMNLDNDSNKTFENSNSTQSDDKQINYKMDELEKKIKNEVLKTEDIEKKLKDAEQREEALIKRITEKDKTIAKMTGVIEAYEKAIAELIADKEQLTQHYEKQLAEVKADRDSNYHHLTSLETTFSDLHVKYEKSKEMTCQLKESEEALQAEKRKNLENLHLQEQRYDKMKNHAMQQLEIANKKLESLTRDHSIEVTKLKALLKKEEIARSSINEQLAHKTKENAELVKICDELISGQGSNFSFEPFDPKKH